MSLKTIVIYLSCIYFIEAAIINVNPDSTPNLKNCFFDESESCKSFSSFCDSYPVIKEVCPRTCGACEGLSDPCAENNGGCSHYCSGASKKTCSCRTGYQLADDGKTCIDINECLDKNICLGNAGVCVNSAGSYSCQRIECKNLGLGFENYYKSDLCCAKKPTNNNVKIDAFGEAASLESKHEDASSAQWPWMAQLLVRVPSRDHPHLCGATLIAKNWVLTAAHCVKNVSREDLTVVLGDDKNAHFKNAPRANRVEKKVVQLIVHPYPEINDIALLKMASPVEFNQLIQPINLPCQETPLEGSTCYVTGFGIEDDDDRASQQLSRKLKEIALPVVSSNYCNWIYRPTSHKFDPRTMMCAGHIGGGQDACFGDGGGPLVCQRFGSCEWYLSGIVSNGKGCGKIGFPGIYTKVAQFQNWIRTVLGDDYTSQC